LSSVEATPDAIQWTVRLGRGSVSTLRTSGNTGREPIREQRTVTLRAWLDEWLQLCATRGLRPSTIASYRTLLALHIDGGLGAVALDELDSVALNALYARLLTNGRRDGRGGLSARTVRYLHTLLNKAFVDAVRTGRLVVNPAAAADPPSPRATRAPVFPVWTPEELARFLRSAQRDPLFAAFQLAAATGLRRGELLGVRWCDLDLEARELHVVQGVVEVAHEPRIGPLKTESSRRLIALDQETVRVMKAHRAAVAARDGEIDERGLVFTTPTGDLIHPAMFSYWFKRRVHLSGVRPIRFHDLRHTHATHALKLGIHPKVVSERLGHSSVMITLDIYSHVTPGLQREAAEAVAALVRG
jgi:integrase